MENENDEIVEMDEKLIRNATIDTSNLLVGEIDSIKNIMKTEDQLNVNLNVKFIKKKGKTKVVSSISFAFGRIKKRIIREPETDDPQIPMFEIS